MTFDPKAPASAEQRAAHKRAFLLRLVLSEALAKRGEGPLAPRFRAAWANSASGTSEPPDDASEKPR